MIQQTFEKALSPSAVYLRRITDIESAFELPAYTGAPIEDLIHPVSLQNIAEHYLNTYLSETELKRLVCRMFIPNSLIIKQLPGVLP